MTRGETGPGIQHLRDIAHWRIHMRVRTAAFLAACFLMLSVFCAGSPPQSGQMTNKDVIELKHAGLRDDVIILRMRSGPTNFTMNTSDIVDLKSSGVSDDVIAEMVKLSVSIVT